MAPLPEPLFVRGVGFETPYCAIYDPNDDVYLVSNINGAPTAADDDGFISRVYPDGELQELKWISGRSQGVILHAPKGMAIRGNTLYVADLTFVRMFDRRSGASKGKVRASGSTFLSGVAAGPNGFIYVADSGIRAGRQGLEATGTDAIYYIDPAKWVPKPLLRTPELQRPNGLAADAGGVWVTTLGNAQLIRVENGGGRRRTVSLPAGGLSGVVLLEEGSMLVSSWEASAIFLGSPDAGFRALVPDVPAPGNIGWDASRRRILIPLFTQDTLRIQPLGPAGES